MTALMTIYELEALSDIQLDRLRETLHRLLMLTDGGSADRRNTLATLENLDRVVHGRKRACAPSL